MALPTVSATVMWLPRGSSYAVAVVTGKQPRDLNAREAARQPHTAMASLTRCSLIARHVVFTEWQRTASRTMTFRQGYAGRIDYDDDDRIFAGRIAGIRDGAGFHADTVDGLRQAFRGNRGLPGDLREDRQGAAEAYSGKVMFLISPDAPQGCLGG